MESKGIVVARQYNASIEDIVNAINENNSVIVVVDGGELLGNRAEEIVEDIVIGQIPDHTVVVLSLNSEDETITIYDPNSSNVEDTYPIEQFKDAWNDSRNYLVTTTANNIITYTPKPIDLSDVELSDDLNELREAIAENAHDVWAVERQAQGWSYGEERNDELKTHPCLIPYEDLPEVEKAYDRDTALGTLKLIINLGFKIMKE